VGSLGASFPWILRDVCIIIFTFFHHLKTAKPCLSFRPYRKRCWVGFDPYIYLFSFFKKILCIKSGLYCTREMVNSFAYKLCIKEHSDSNIYIHTIR
jgi:hypothetical protein